MMDALKQELKAYPEQSDQPKNPVALALWRGLGHHKGPTKLMVQGSAEIERLERELAAAESKVEALTKDAERYRKLKEMADDEENIPALDRIISETATEDWDAAIDAAMKEQANG